ncbi:hypothetical protein DEF24_19400 [Marinitenerispora sediminis]|uniref:Uncharacterized protein n=1 Tax=Marinitenerispora sediminis TaxID=1931232 RepID=A0A368T1Y1_9ACTN|nr:hypothetical protein DEF24_19400 [Marinitenerispora sediminis]
MLHHTPCCALIDRGNMRARFLTFALHFSAADGSRGAPPRAGAAGPAGTRRGAGAGGPAGAPVVRAGGGDGARLASSGCASPPAEELDAAHRPPATRSAARARGSGRDGTGEERPPAPGPLRVGPGRIVPGRLAPMPVAPSHRDVRGGRWEDPSGG